MTVNWSDLVNKATPSTATVSTSPIVTAAESSAYGAAALRAETDRVRFAVPGTRNDELNRAAFNLGQLVIEGHLTQGDVEAALVSAALAAGLSPSEVRLTLGSGLKGATGKRRTNVPDPSETVEYPVNVEEVDELSLVGSRVDDLFDQRPVLTHIRDFALSRMTSPAAVLGVTLLRVLALVPPTVVLPALIGGLGSLNLFCALVGPSGSGKGAAESAAKDAFRWPEHVFLATTGSGEGIAHCYAHIDKGNQVDDRHSVLFTVAEVDTLAAISSRQGSTLLSQLRSAFSGERLGFSYADRSRRLLLERHNYRLGMIVGVQPERALGLLNDTDGGTPQRFIWVPATDRRVSATPPPEPAPITLTMPQWVALTRQSIEGYNVIHIPQEVADEIRANHAARARGEGTALDGHAMFAREKVAFALAVLDGRAIMDLDDWRIAGMVMNLSEVTRTSIERVLAVKADRKQEYEVQAEIRRQGLMDDAKDAKALVRVRARLEKVAAGGPVTRRDLQRALASRDSDYFEDALDVALTLGTIRDVSTLEESRFVAGGAS